MVLLLQLVVLVEPVVAVLEELIQPVAQEPPILAVEVAEVTPLPVAQEAPVLS